MGKYVIRFTNFVRREEEEEEEGKLMFNLARQIQIQSGNEVSRLTRKLLSYNLIIT